MNIENFSLTPDCLRLTWNDGHVNEFHYIWLRDNCNCPSCRHPQVGERTLDSATIPLDIRPAEVQMNGGEALTIIWSGDHHQTSYSPAWLRQHSYEPEERAARRFQPTLWDSSLLANMPEVTYESVMADDEGLLTWLRLIRRYGTALVRGVPTERGQVAKVAERIAFLRPSNFGLIFDVESKPDPNSIAYTSVELKAHIDLVSREMMPGLQFLHCLVFEATGGESLLVDGFQAAKVLQQRHPDDYAVLTSTPVRFRYQDRETDITFKSPMIRLDADGELFEIRYSIALLAPLDINPELVKPFYKAYLNFTKILRDPALEIRFQLRPGDLMAFDNRRVLHGRAAFDPQSGPRQLQGCYVDTDDFLSRLRVLEQRYSEEE